jgi:hypothetical protein
MTKNFGFPKMRQRLWHEVYHCPIKPASEAWPRPIPVSERLPELDTEVLVFAPCIEGGKWLPVWRHPVGPNGEPWVWCTRIDSERGMPAARFFNTVTHWLSLPPNP